jgi:DNA repair photolyase
MTEDTIKRFNGKAIKMPKGKAGEYAKYSCNFYVGCSNGCTYCYLRKPPFNNACGGSVPTLAKCFKDEKHALEVFEKELKANLPELQKHGLFFTFTSDPMLQETRMLSTGAATLAVKNRIPVKFLTKVACINFILNWVALTGTDRSMVAFGFTLTGHDEMEPNASTNAERIEAMRKLHDAGFKTWASIEPVIDFDSSLKMISDSKDFCDLYKIGLESGKKYDKVELQHFVSKSISLLTVLRDENELFLRKMFLGNVHKAYDFNGKFYFKDSLLQQAGINRENLPVNCVSRDWDMF